MSAKSRIQKSRDIETEYHKEKTKDEPLENPSTSTDAKTSKLTISLIPQYKRILVPDDHSGYSDKALSHAVYLSNTTSAEIVILNVVDNIDKIQQLKLRPQLLLKMKV